MHGWRFAFVALVAFSLVPTPARGADRIAVSQYGTVLASLPWAVALDQGILKRDGLEIDGFVGSNGGGTAIRNMMASSVPFAEVSTPAAIAAVAQGYKLRIVYAAVNNIANTCWNVRADAPIHTLADLRGHTVGYDSPQGTTEMLIRMILRKAKLENDVHLLATGGSAAGVTALEAGAVDAAPRPDLFPSNKLRVLFEATQYVPDLVWTVGVTTDDFAKAHPEVIRKLIAARREAVDLIYAHPEIAAATFASVWQVDPVYARAVIAHSIAMNYWSRGSFSRAGLAAMFDGMRLIGAMPPAIDAGALVDPGFLPPDQQRETR